MEVNDQLHKLAALSTREENPVLVQREDGLVPQRVWMFWVREISFASTGIRTQDRPDSSPASVSTELMKNVNVGKFNEDQICKTNFGTP